MGKLFEILDHTADVGLVAWGRSLEELFANAALGMFSLIGELEKVNGGFETSVAVEGSDWEDLLVAWLNELLYVFEVEEALLNHFDIQEFGQYYLRARVFGEPLDLKKHEVFRVVKACTYYEARVEEIEPGLFRAQVYFDI
ncbi:MAG: archease [Candidatus Caldatribacteriaceae bacterium]